MSNKPFASVLKSLLLEVKEENTKDITKSFEVVGSLETESKFLKTLQEKLTTEYLVTEEEVFLFTILQQKNALPKIKDHVDVSNHVDPSMPDPVTRREIELLKITNDQLKMLSQKFLDLNTKISEEIPNTSKEINDVLKDVTLVSSRLSTDLSQLREKTQEMFKEFENLHNSWPTIMDNMFQFKEQVIETLNSVQEKLVLILDSIIEVQNNEEKTMIPCRTLVSLIKKVELSISDKDEGKAFGIMILEDLHTMRLGELKFFEDLLNSIKAIHEAFNVIETIGKDLLNSILNCLTHLEKSEENSSLRSLFCEKAVKLIHKLKKKASPKENDFHSELTRRPDDDIIKDTFKEIKHLYDNFSKGEVVCASRAAQRLKQVIITFQNKQIEFEKLQLKMKFDSELKG